MCRHMYFNLISSTDSEAILLFQVYAHAAWSEIALANYGLYIFWEAEAILLAI